MLSKHYVLLALSRRLEHYCQRSYTLNTFNFSLFQENVKFSCLNQVGFSNQNKSICSNSKGENVHFTKNVSKELKTIIEKKKEKFKEKEKKLKEKGTMILKDIKETKDKVKEKVEEVVEACFVF